MSITGILHVVHVKECDKCNDCHGIIWHSKMSFLSMHLLYAWEGIHLFDIQRREHTLSLMILSVRDFILYWYTIQFIILWMKKSTPVKANPILTNQREDPVIGFSVFWLINHVCRTDQILWDITWMSEQSVHLAKWMHASERVTVWHLVKCPPHLTKMY